MTEDAYELTTEDLIETFDTDSIAPPSVQVGLPTPRTRSNVSVTGATPPPAPTADRPRFVPSALSRPIKERTRSQRELKLDEGPTSLVSKAAAFFEEALEAEREGDVAAAIRHVKLAMTFNPADPRYAGFLSKLR